MDKDMQEMFQLIIDKIDHQDKNFKAIDQRFEAIDRRFDTVDQRFEAIDRKFESVYKKIDDQSRDLKLYIENKVEKRIEALFDGYKLVHEKQWEQDKQISDLRDDLEVMKVELYSLKKKVG